MAPTRRSFLKNLGINEISLVGDPANEAAVVSIVKMKTGAAGLTAEEILKQETDMDLETLTKNLKDAEARLEALTKKQDETDAVIKAKDAEIEALKAEVKKAAEEVEKAKKAAGPSDDEIMKSFPKAAQEMIAKANETATAASAAVQKMADDRDLDMAIAKAKTHGIGKAEDVAAIMLRVRKGKTTAEDAEAIEKLLDTAAKVAKGSNLFKKTGSDVAVDGDPEALLKAKADEIFKAAADAKQPISKAAAYDKALDQNPGLYAAYVEKKRGSVSADTQ